MNAPLSIRNAFTVDVEDYYHVSAFARIISSRQWDDYESHVVDNTHRILRLLEEYQVRATFFVLGWVADRFPGLVRDIQRSGHEIGCHSYWHRLIYEQTPDEFRDDLLRAKDVIEQISGEQVIAYRAPSFSITQNSLWALEILRDAGICLDSSVVPVRHDRYGIPGAESRIHQIETAAGILLEFPPTVYRAGRLNVPVGGGGYFRLYPYLATRYCLRASQSNAKQPVMFYVHPWEVDPLQPRLPGSALSRFRHYVNLDRTEAKLRRLLRDFRFASFSDVVTDFNATAASDAAPRLRFDQSASSCRMNLATTTN
jgi:polysaccharide deacetylase family protein (PEP-CTERM system associated)